MQLYARRTEHKYMLAQFQEAIKHRVNKYHPGNVNCFYNMDVIEIREIP